LGAKARVLASGQVTAGKHSLSWDGKNPQGIPVKNGSYQIVSLINGSSQVKKIVVIK
jgi:flagellar hook assembly protein FlgD